VVRLTLPRRPAPGQARLDGGTGSTRHGVGGAGRLITVDGLGTYLRTWRARLRPADVGLPAAGPRRARGLRREEVAALAGISVDYLVRLEQGRAMRPSAAVLAALSRALRLDPDERDHLYTVAGHLPPKRTHVCSHVTPGIQRMVDRLGDVPVAVFDAAWTIVLWNPLWAALMGDPSGRAGRERNIAWRTFTKGGSSWVSKTPAAARAFEEFIVADLRRVSANYPDDAELVRLLADLRRVSTSFDTLWQRQLIAHPDSGPKTIEHPEVGPVTVDCDVLTAVGTDLRIIVYTAAPSSPDAEKLELVRVLGLQRLGETAEPPSRREPGQQTVPQVPR